MWAIFALKSWGVIAQKIAGPLMIIAWWVQNSGDGYWPGPVPGIYQSTLDESMEIALLAFVVWNFWYLSQQPIKVLFRNPGAFGNHL